MLCASRIHLSVPSPLLLWSSALLLHAEIGIKLYFLPAEHHLRYVWRLETFHSRSEEDEDASLISDAWLER